MNFIVHLHLFPAAVMVSIAETDDELDKTLREAGITEKEIQDKNEWASDGEWSGLMVCFDRGDLLLRLRDVPDTPRSRAVLAHEVLHATHKILKRMGFKLSDKTEEVYAYTNDYLTRCIYEEIEEHQANGPAHPAAQ